MEGGRKEEGALHQRAPLLYDYCRCEALHLSTRGLKLNV